MIKRTGVITAALTIILAIAAAAVAVLWTAVGRQITPAPQLSPTGQKLIAPTEKVNTSWFTTLGKLEDQKQQLQVLDATVQIVKQEFDFKISLGQAAYAAIAAALSAYASAHATVLYKNKTMYSETEVTEIKKNGKTV
ncbi:MAG: hypothetical protein MUP81_03375 [Dehalococcoidia bacterium]|nr:hypothetical protein [Dehalococcoidia bacterium]